MISRVNLIPKTPLAESIKKLIPMAFFSMILILGLFVSIRICFLNSTFEGLQAKVGAIEILEKQRDEIVTLVATLTSDAAIRKGQLQQKSEVVAKLSRIVGDKRQFSRPLLLIADVLPTTIRCKHIEFTGLTGSLVGTSLDYNDLIVLVKRLQDDPAFTNVSLIVTDRDNSQKIEKIQFSIDLELG